MASASYVQKLRVEPPAKYTGTAKEDFERWYRRITNYMCLTDETFGTILTEIKDNAKTPITDTTLANIDTRMALADGSAQNMARAMYYTLDSLLGDAPLLLIEAIPDMNGFEALRQLCHRYMKSKQMTGILLLVKIINYKFNDKDFETSFATWENDVTKFEQAIGKELYEEMKVGLLIAGTTGQLHEHLCLTASQAATYTEVRDVVLNYVKHRSIRMPGTTRSHDHNANYNYDPMDVNAAFQKGLQKGSGKPACGFCGLPGHSEQYCWKKQNKGKGQPQYFTPSWGKGGKSKGFPKGGKNYYNNKGGKGKPWRPFGGKPYFGKGKQKGKVQGVDYEEQPPQGEEQPQQQQEAPPRLLTTR